MSEQHPLAHSRAAGRAPEPTNGREAATHEPGAGSPADSAHAGPAADSPAVRSLRARLLAGERDRIATELNARVITRAFRVGLAVAALIDAHPDLAADLYPVMDETDTLIREVRHIAFDVRQAG